MCGRTSLFIPKEQIEKRFDAEFTEKWTSQYNIAPEDKLPVVQNTSRDEINQLE